MAHSGISGFCSPPALWHSSPRTSFLTSLLVHMTPVAALQFSFFPTLPHSEFRRERTKQYTIDQKDAVSLHAQKVKSLAMMDPNQVECVKLSKERLCHKKKKLVETRSQWLVGGSKNHCHSYSLFTSQYTGWKSQTLLCSWRGRWQAHTGALQWIMKQFWPVRDKQKSAGGDREVFAFIIKETGKDDATLAFTSSSLEWEI